MAISEFFKRLFGKNHEEEEQVKENLMEPIKYEIDEEDRVVVALAASIMAGKDKPNSNFHITKITRIQ